MLNWLLRLVRVMALPLGFSAGSSRALPLLNLGSKVCRSAAMVPFLFCRAFFSVSALTTRL